MKILLITPRFYPEPFTISRIAEELVNRGHQITVLTGKPHYGKWHIYSGYEKVNTEDYKGIKIIRLNETPRKKGIIGLVLNYLSIKRIYSKALKKMTEKYDIVFSHAMSPIFFMNGISSYCKRTNTPHFHYGFDLWPESLIAAGYFKRNSLFFSQIKKVSINNYKGCDQITFASPSAEKYFRDYLQLDVNFKHIYQPCLTDKPSLQFVDGHKYRQEDKIHILFCGTIAKFNHLDLIIKSLDNEYLKANIVFDIVGSGSDKENIEKIVEEKHLNDTVVFHGRVTPAQTRDFYKNADVLFVPLFYNSATSLMIPQKLIEYFMYSRPIFGMIKGDGADLLEKASSQNIVADQTVDSLQESLIKLLKMSNEDFEKCGKENRKFFDDNPRFSLDRICDEIEECLINLKRRNV